MSPQSVAADRPVVRRRAVVHFRDYEICVRNAEVLSSYSYRREGLALQETNRACRLTLQSIVGKP